MKSPKIVVADLYCGAGGTSTGMVEAAAENNLDIELTAINHWDVAVATHTENHPGARHLCTNIDNVNPGDLYKEDELDILWASPECIYHSKARGGKPIKDQSRSTPWCVCRWAERLRPKIILIENVLEFLNWAPIGANGRPIKSRRGEIFRAWVATLQAIGYRLEWRELCAADYGDPTTRRRLFIQAVRGRRKIIWPEPTHTSEPGADFFTIRKPWIPAREIIQWEVRGTSIYKRKKPLAEKTLARIMTGLERFGLAPFVLPQQRGGRPVHPVSDPISTVATSGAHALVEPFLVQLRVTSTARSIEKPIPTITAGGGHIGVVQPYLVQTAHGKSSQRETRRARSIEEPLPTVTGNGDWALCHPFIATIDQQSNKSGVQSIDKPLSTTTTKARHGLVEPFIIPFFGERKGQVPRTQSINDPLPTVTSHGAGALVEPFLVQYNGTSDAQSIHKPLGTITTKPRFGLAQPVLKINGKHYLLDILFRMLNKQELAAAQGFQRHYKFVGNSKQVVKQIGNAVPRNLAKALTSTAIKNL